MTTVTQVQAAPLPEIYQLKASQTSADNLSSSDSPDIPLPAPPKELTQILSVDKGTPDEHVPRDPRLIRLTGVHPFNVEPPLTDLYGEGMPHIHRMLSDAISLISANY